MSAHSLPHIALIAAVAANGVMGRDGGMPWHLPADFRYFKQKTMGHRIIMGRRTWQSLPGLLPGREHVVVSSQPLQLPPGVRLACSLQQALQLPLPGDMVQDRVFVIGGAQIYAQALDLADSLYLTEIDAAVEGDTFFPPWDRSAFVEVSRESQQVPIASADPSGAPVPFAFVHYRRRDR
ncbi:hypothetical protein AAV94_06885 [Lampropedia cohaerens]|uniref:Dihydrofolate reductase n=1 Tax=Lampropedia cohaerens TaxID=1610491 RepID=A0A0U1Q0F4_9BURK|nr:dihydrofolate reductase [Lampropedia cohaerens]KKW68216.1 hypothetical protein AAV94_06885 [Lampropedia cohaerens]